MTIGGIIIISAIFKVNFDLSLPFLCSSTSSSRFVSRKVGAIDRRSCLDLRFSSFSSNNFALIPVQSVILSCPGQSWSFPCPGQIRCFVAVLLICWIGRRVSFARISGQKLAFCSLFFRIHPISLENCASRKR